MFWGLLEHDLLITRKQLGGVLAQVLMQPLLMLLVFGKVLGALGYTPPGYARLLLPGLVALNAFFAAVQNASFPLAMEFATRTIENRLRAPVPLAWIVVERIFAAASRGLVTAARIGITFSLVMPPLLFTGSAQFPFPELGTVPWFRALCALNPMTYVSEGLRGSLTPQIAHLPAWLSVAGLAAALLVFTPASLWAFRRRAIT
ncbi:ABC-2 type transporter [Amycolatopsis azurea DSM 43854]|uniref:ABC-2 type transporter n=1 Tax=Amycolatopsis azurea DSM 43854 TaxID=1238180 RepID=M2Q913_9PSEU|nr:ABC-2 type transporter [Amycolatopsis azurea DSM 43854]